MLKKFKLLLIKFAFLSLISPSEQGVLPMPRLSRLPKYIKQRHFAALSSPDYVEHTSYRENSPLRKTPTLHFNYDAPLPNMLHKNFDSNGMIVISPAKYPQDRENKLLNQLINKVIDYKINEKSDRYLRHHPESVFDEGEIQKMQEIVGAIDERPQQEERQVPSIVYEFSDLVL